MEIVAFVAVAVVVVAVIVVGGVLVWLDRRPAPAAPAPSPDPWAVVVARRVVVNLKTGRALDGVLVRRDGPLLFLKNAVLLEEGNEPATIDGEAVVQAVEIDFIQAL
ncbi:RNA binding protein [Arthrobacter phage TaylorSipht]|nr:RNA binding protein [Arthrobacter phage TaylorSipht]